MTNSPDPQSIDNLIAQRLPTWLSAASIDPFNLLRRALIAQQRDAEHLASILDTLPTLDRFAESSLTHALRARGIPQPDVRRSTVRVTRQKKMPSVGNSLPGPVIPVVSRQSLLGAAMHNFHVVETRPHFMRSGQLLDRHGRPLPLGMEAFAGLCRQLDLGKAYQALLRQKLQPEDAPGQPAGSAAGAVHRAFENALRANLEVDLRITRLKGQLDERHYLQMLPVIAVVPIVPAVPYTVTARQPYLLGKCLRGIVAFEVRETGKQPLSAVIAWVPGDPAQPLTAHESWDALYRALATRLREATYRGFFQRFISQRDRPQFMAALAASGADDLDGRHLPLTEPLFQHLRRQRIDTLFDDARLLAVPTGDEDEEDRLQRLQSYEAVGMNVLALAGLLVPVLGQALLVVGVAQIADEVYEGYKDWTIGDRRGAIDHALNVAETLVLGAALAGAGTAATQVLQRSVFVDGLLPVRVADGQLRLVDPHKSGLAQAHHWQGAPQLLKGLGKKLEKLPASIGDDLLQVTGFSEDQLRRLQLEAAPAPGRLLQWADLYWLRQEQPALEGAELLARWRMRQGQPSASEQVLSRDFPSLSLPVVRDVLAQASGAELDALVNRQRVPLSLAERARWAAREHRLDRAFAGLRWDWASNPDSERLVSELLDPSLSGAEQAEALQERVRVLNRDEAATLLGMRSAKQAWLRPPTRFADGRLGYPLSGRGESSRQAMRRGIHQVFPTLTDLQMDAYLQSLARERTGLWQHCSLLQEHLALLREALGGWQRSWSNPLDALRRRRVARTIRRSWRRKITDLGEDFVLEIDGEAVGSLPALPAGISFAHIRRLRLCHMALEDIDSDFLERFGHVVELDLSGNRLAAIPEGLQHMRGLRILRLSDNRIVLDSAGEQRLAALHALQMLDLSHNPLGRAPVLTQLTRLRDVRLRDTGLASLPAPVTWRGRLDLRDNQIRAVQHDLDSLRNRLEQVTLHDNPLDEASQGVVDEAAGTPQGARGGASFRHAPVDTLLRDQWTGAVDAPLRSRRHAIWAAVHDEPGSADLFRFLADFFETDEVAEYPQYYRKRIWRILEACEQHTELRQRLFLEAAGPGACDDRLLLILEQLEIAVLAQTARGEGIAAFTESRLIQLGRGLFRLDEVDRIATRHIEALRQQGAVLIDDIEIRLYFRTKLRRALALPISPDEMHYEDFAVVSQSQLQAAQAEVLAAEVPEVVADAIAQRPFWAEHARNFHAERFEQLARTFHERFEALQAQVDGHQIDEWTYEVRSRGLKYEYEQAETKLLRTLVREAMQLAD